jgi:hypothetical protein
MRASFITISSFKQSFRVLSSTVPSSCTAVVVTDVKLLAKHTPDTPAGKLKPQDAPHR